MNEFFTILNEITSFLLAILEGEINEFLAILKKIILSLVTILGGAAALLGIYRGVLAIKNRGEETSSKRFRDARQSAKDNRERLRRSVLKLKQHTASHLTLNEGIPLFVKENWLTPHPVPLENVTLGFHPDPGVKLSLSASKLPSYSTGKYRKYSDAIADLDKPSIFEDRLQYRLIKIDGTRLSFSEEKYSYFDKINYGEYLVHELAQDSLGKRSTPLSSNRRRLLKHFREPADYVVLTGICTLTLIHNGTNLRIIMHLRGQKETAYAMGTFHVIPAGEFQPSCLAPVSFREDFDLWKSIMREYAEELLCMDEYDGSSTVPFNYSVEPFISLERERVESNIKAFYLGTGLDVMTFQGEILTAVVFREMSFKKIFSNVLGENREGKIITDKGRWGRQFTQEEYDSYKGSNILGTGEAILNIVWRNMQFFKTCFD